jgi:hypothetical protein
MASIRLTLQKEIEYAKRLESLNREIPALAIVILRGMEYSAGLLKGAKPLEVKQNECSAAMQAEVFFPKLSEVTGEYGAKLRNMYDHLQKLKKERKDILKLFDSAK